MSGCRVIVSSKAGSQCLVGNGNGVIVDPFNDKDIKDKIIYMLDNTNSRNIGKLRPNNMIFNYYDLLLVQEFQVADIQKHLCHF